MKYDIEKLAKRILRSLNHIGPSGYARAYESKKARWEAQQNFLKKQENIVKMNEIILYYEKFGFQSPFAVLFLIKEWYNDSFENPNYKSEEIRMFLKEVYRGCGANWDNPDPNSKAWARATALVDTNGQIFAYRFVRADVSGKIVETKILEKSELTVSIIEALNEFKQMGGFSIPTHYFEPHATIYENNIRKRIIDIKINGQKKSAVSAYEGVRQECLKMGLTEKFLDEIILYAKDNHAIQTLRVIMALYSKNVGEIIYTEARIIGVFRKYHKKWSIETVRNYIELVVRKPKRKKVQNALKQIKALEYAKMIFPEMDFQGTLYHIFPALHEYLDLMNSEKS